MGLRMGNTCPPMADSCQCMAKPPKYCKVIQFSSVAQSCPTLCYPMDYSTSGFPVQHQLPELVQTHGCIVSHFYTISASRGIYSPSHHPVSLHSSLLPSFFFLFHSFLCLLHLFICTSFLHREPGLACGLFMKYCLPIFCLEVGISSRAD